MPSTNNLSTVNLQEIFNLTDKKGRGSIEANKIGDLLRYSGLNPTERACSQIIERVGKSHINLNDFSAIYEENQDASLEFKSISGDYADSTSLKYSMINAIRTFDHQGTGFISINEFKFILTGLGDKLKDTEFDDLRQFMEVSPNGQVSYDQFIDSISKS